MRSQSLQDIDVVILAGGRGQRLGALTDAVPKPLVEVGGQSLLDRSLHQLETLRVRRIVVVGAYRMPELVAATEAFAWRISPPEIVWQ